MLLGDLGDKIRSQREKRGLKQQNIASALQVSPQAVSKWERGENAPDIALMGPLSRLLGVTTDWLLSVHAEPMDVFEATVLASSVRGAYEKSLGMEARDFATWANGLFLQLTEVTLRHDGVPIKFMGDQYLCFFSGVDHRRRAIQAALRAQAIVPERLTIGLSCGEIYLGSVGHPDYARPDIMGEVVNIAFLTKDWAESRASTRMAATAAVVAEADGLAAIGLEEEGGFKGIENSVRVCEILVEPKLNS